MRKILILLLALTLGLNTAAQDGEKRYRYIIVPLQYNFTFKPNQYQLNVLTRVMLKQEGFEVYMSEGEQIPEFVANNPCSTLKADVKKDSGLFNTNLKFQLFNCFGNLVYESVGSSREKAYEDAYKEALKEALTEFQIDSFKFLKLEDDIEEESYGPVEQVDNTPKTFEEKATSFSVNDKKLWMVKEDEDYLIYEDLGKTKWATLKYADQGTYSFESENINGAAYFTPEGNIVIEYLAKGKDALQKMIIDRQ